MPIFATLHHFRAEMGDVTSSFSDPSVTPLSDYTALGCSSAAKHVSKRVTINNNELHLCS